MAEMRENPDLDAAMAETIGRLEEAVRTLANQVAQGDVSKVADAVASRITPAPQQPPPLPGTTSPTTPSDATEKQPGQNATDARPFDWEQRWGDVKAIRESIDRVLANAVLGRSEPKESKEPRRDQEPEKRSSPFRPLTDAFFQRTQVGRIIARTIDRVRPHLDTIRKSRAGRVFRSARGAESALNRHQNVTGRKPSASNIARAGRSGRVTQTTVAAGEGVAARGAGAAAGRGAGAMAGRAVGMAGGRAAGAAAGAAAGSAGGPAGLVIGLAVGAVFGEVLSGLVDLAKAARDAAYQQERVTRELAQFSPQQAGQIAMLDAQRTVRKYELGQATAGSSQALTESINRFEQATLPLEKLATSFMNDVGAGLMDGLTSIVEMMQPLIDAAEAVAEVFTNYQRREESPNATFGDFLDKVANDRQQRRSNTAAAIDRLKRTGRF